MCQRGISLAGLPIGVCLFELLLKVLQVTRVGHLCIEVVRATALDDVLPTCSTRICSFERTAQDQHRLLESTRIGGHVLQVRPECFDQFVPGDVAAALQVEQRQECLGFAARELLADCHLADDGGPQRPEQIKSQQWVR